MVDYSTLVSAGRNQTTLALGDMSGEGQNIKKLKVKVR